MIHPMHPFDLLITPIIAEIQKTSYHGNSVMCAESLSQHAFALQCGCEGLDWTKTTTTTCSPCFFSESWFGFCNTRLLQDRYIVLVK